MLDLWLASGAALEPAVVAAGFAATAVSAAAIASAAITAGRNAMMHLILS
jgi:hypothetical protein